MPFGYNGCILHVNLTNSKISIEKPNDNFYKLYIGGSTLALYYMLTQSPAGIDALDPDNPLIIAVSPLTGASISGASRVTAMAKSPLTDCIGDSQGGGFFPVQLKFSGFDAIVLTGKSPHPVYLWLNDGHAELRDAKHLWGKLTSEVEDAIRSNLGDSKIEVLQCGIAAENGVRFANLLNNCNRANGRTGMGAVMASKNLKAIAARGNRPISICDKEALLALSKKGASKFRESQVYSFRQYGTAGGINWQNSSGGLPTRNWSSGVFNGAEKLDGTVINDKYLVRRDTCYGCIVRCKPVVSISDNDSFVDPRFGGPEYETLSTFGSYCGIDDLKAIAQANQLCNMYGMDTISCGATIAWAMDCHEKGIISSEDTHGIDLHFGNAEAMLMVTEMIAKREGIGNLLAEGSARAAQRFGKAAEDLVVCSKQQELPAHMPQVKRSLALIYAVNPSGADHQSSEHDTAYTSYTDRMAQLGLNEPQPEDVLNDEKVKFAYITQCLYSAMDCLDVCQFVFGAGWQLYDTEQLVELVNAVTGWDVDKNDILSLGERKLAMMRVFNSREGITQEQDALPLKMSESLTKGITTGVRVEPKEVQQAIKTYYHIAGYNDNGIPHPEKLCSLGLEWLIEAAKQ